MTRPLAILTLFVALFVYHSATAQVPPDTFSERMHIGRGAVLNAQWHPSGQWILVDTITGGWLYSSTLADGAQLPDVRLARFNPDGTVVAGIDSANQLTLRHWDNQTFTQLRTYPGHTTYVTALEWSPDGKQIATLDRTGRILVWDAASGRDQFEVRLNGATQIEWSKGESYLAAINTKTQTFAAWERSGYFVLSDTPAYTASGGRIEWQDDSHILRKIFGEGVSGEVWDIHTRQALGRLGSGTVMAYSPDGSSIALGFYGAATIVDTFDSNNKVDIDGPTAGVIAWSPSGKRVAFGDWTPELDGSGRLWVYDVESGELQQQFSREHIGSIHAIYWNPGETKLLTVDSANQLFIWPIIENGGAIYPDYRSIAHTDVGGTMAWNSDGSIIVAGDSNLGSRAWDVRNGTPLVERMNIGHSARQVAWQPGGTLVATTSDDGWRGLYHNVYIWDTANPQLVLSPVTVIPHVNNVRRFAWNPDGKSLVTAESSWFLRVWKPDDPDTVQTLDIRPLIGDGSGITGIAWSHKGDIVVVPNSSSTVGAIALIDVASQTLLPGYRKQSSSDVIDGLLAWAWTPANQFVGMRWGSYTRAGAYDFLIQILYDPASDTSQRAILLSGLAKPGTKAIFSPDADKVIGFDQADNAIIWDLHPQSLRARLYGVKDAVWSPDESMLVTYGVDGVLRVVDATTGDILHSFDDHFNADYPRISVFWSPDSRKIALLDRGALFIYEKTA